METKDQKYQRAVDHIAKVRKLYRKIINAIIFVIITAGVNYYVNELENPWFLWVLGFSLIGIIIDSLKVYGISFFLGKGWEQRKIREHMEKEDDDFIIRK